MESRLRDLIYILYTGRWSITPELLAKLGDPQQIDTVDPSKYYLRINMLFEVADGKYAWLNRLIAIATGQRTATGIRYTVAAVK